MSDTTTPPKAVWPVITYSDVPAALRFLADALGFEQTEASPGADGAIVHAELRWPEGGGVMLSGANDASPFARPAGAALVYVVTDRPDELHARAVAAGADVVMGLTDQPYGSREFAVRDPEGNIWSFGTYRGAAA